MASGLPDYAPFTPKDSPDDAVLWGDWLEGFIAMIGALNVEEDTPAVQAADAEGDAAAVVAIPARTRRFELLWHYIGKDSRKTLKKLANNGIDTKEYRRAHEALTAQFAPILNRIYQMHVLAEIKQGEKESMDSFYTKIKERVDMMKLEEMTVQQLIDLITMAQLVNKTTNMPAKRKALKEGNLTLRAFLDHARIVERTDQQMSAMHGETASVSYVNKNQKGKGGQKKKKKDSAPPSNSGSRQRKEKCKYCGNRCEKGRCPAFGVMCGNCG